MARKISLFPGLFLIPLISLLSSCSPTEMTPMPNSSIVWSDDFEDGDTEGWEIEDGMENMFTVEEGIVSFFDYGWLAHPSLVSIGTWSADIFIPDAGEGFTLINFMSNGVMGDDPSGWRNLGIVIEHQPATTIWLGYWDGSKANNIKPETISDGQRLTGLHHVDITRDERGVVKAYINKKLVLESGSDYPHEPNYFGFAFCCEGPGLDNVVVRNQAIDIQPIE